MKNGLQNVRVSLKIINFPVNVLTKLKKTIVVLRIVIQLRTSLALDGQNKRLLHLTTGTTGT